MQRRVYVNKSSSWGREFFGILLIIALIGVACGIAWWTLRDDGRSDDKPAPQATALRPADDSHALKSAEDAPADLRALFEMVRASPHVTQNEMYSAVARNIRFVYDSNDDEINAYATLESLGGGARRPVVVLLAGFTRLAEVAALTLADSHHRGDSDKMQSLVKSLRDNWQGTLSKPQAGLFVFEKDLYSIDDDKVVEEAKGIEAGMLIAAIAHEVGHLALGHLYRTKSEKSPEISRNQEREADLFASSVMSASPFGQYIFEGFFLFHFVNAAKDESDLDYKTRSHPYSRERLINLIRQNQSKAKALGFTEEKVLQLFPPIQEKPKSRFIKRFEWIFRNMHKEETAAVLPSGPRQLAKCPHLSCLWRLDVQGELYMACNGRHHAFEEE